MSLLNKENPSIDDWKPTTTQVMDLFEFLKSGAEKVVAAQPDSVAPILAVMCLDPLEDDAEPIIRVHLCGGGFSSKLEKKIQMKRNAAAIYKAKLVPIAVGLVSEAWCVMGQPNQNQDEMMLGHLLCSDHPQRVEIVSVSVLGFHGPGEPGLSMLDCRKLKRLNGTPEQGPVTFDGEWQIEQSCREHSKPYEPSTDGGDANLLEGFFWSYVCFAMRREDADHYLDGCVVEPLEAR